MKLEKSLKRGTLGAVAAGVLWMSQCGEDEKVGVNNGENKAPHTLRVGGSGGEIEWNTPDPERVREGVHSEWAIDQDNGEPLKDSDSIEEKWDHFFKISDTLKECMTEVRTEAYDVCLYSKGNDKCLGTLGYTLTALLDECMKEDSDGELDNPEDLFKLAIKLLNEQLNILDIDLNDPDLDHDMIEDAVRNFNTSDIADIIKNILDARRVIMLLDNDLDTEHHDRNYRMLFIASQLLEFNNQRGSDGNNFILDKDEYIGSDQ